jgi:hypothetical protein
MLTCLELFYESGKKYDAWLVVNFRIYNVINSITKGSFSVTNQNGFPDYF